VPEIVEAANALCDLLEATAAGTFYMEDATVKAWILGPGGRTGNCEDCIENADAGEIEESEFFPAYGPDGPVDEPPLHPFCTCYVEYRDTRRRVYV
jgi:hypothetical protein